MDFAKSSRKNLGLTDANGKHLQLYAILVKERLDRSREGSQSLELMYGYDLDRAIDIVKNKYSETKNLVIEVLGNLAVTEFLKPVIDDIKELKEPKKGGADAIIREANDAHVERKLKEKEEEEAAIDLRTDKFIQNVAYVHEIVSPILTEAENKVMMKVLRKFKEMFVEKVKSYKS